MMVKLTRRNLSNNNFINYFISDVLAIKSGHLFNSTTTKNEKTLSIRDDGFASSLYSQTTPPYNQDFTFPLTGWYLGYTFNANVGNGPTSASTNYWQQKPFMGNTAANDQSLCVNMYTSNISYWAVTNAFDLSAGDYEISFDYATTNGPFMTNPNGPAPQVEGGDKFKILVTTDNGATWQELRNWDNPNITISNERNKLTIDVSAYKSNNVKFAFYASDGTVFNSQANYRIFVDNFKVQLKSSMNVTESGKSNFTVFPNPTAGKISVKSKKMLNHWNYTKSAEKVCQPQQPMN
jgi:hypothetical protein